VKGIEYKFILEYGGGMYTIAIIIFYYFFNYEHVLVNICQNGGFVKIGDVED